MVRLLANRRALLLALGIALGAAGGGLARRRARRDGGALLRPPGAGSEDELLAACIRCGQCVIACPYDTLQLAPPAAGLGAGTPFVDAREVPCSLCQGYEELRCIEECPTTALRPLADWRAIDMGVAVIDRSRCLAWNRTMCRACWHACPFPNEAIRLDWRTRPEVDADACIGCGLCDHACLTEPSSIPIAPRAAFRAGDPTFVGAGTG